MKIPTFFPRIRWRVVCIAAAVLLTTGATWAGFWWHGRYATSDEMLLPVREYSAAEYPEDPGEHSVHLCQYSGRRLRLIRRDATHFDFVFEPRNSHTATVAFLDIDVSLMTPGEPAWTKTDKDLERIALTDRQWNRQQVRFARDSRHIEITGGDGFETAKLFTAELAKNCLNAGLWEVLLTVEENGRKATYYHGWFTFPLGHYRRVFEHNTELSYWDHWYKLEHWSDPAGTPIRLDALRTVRREGEVVATFDTDEALTVAGEQVLKRRTVDAKNLMTWRDFVDGPAVHFATFIPPGRYSVRHPWKNQFYRISQFDKAIWREVESPATSRPLRELELIFRNRETAETCRFFVSGFDLSAVPQLPISQYPNGLYMPMGIGVPPFYQSYDELQGNRPDKSPYFSVMLDNADRWINHHEVAVDGPVMHRDEHNPNLLHVYLLSYERHSLVAHVVVTIPNESAASDGL